MKTILVATDFSKSANNATEYAVEMALSAKAKIVLLHVYQIPYSYGEIPVPIDHDTQIQDATNLLRKIKEQIINTNGAELTIETQVRIGTFYNQLKECCKDIMPYAVILGSHGNSAMQHILFGSNSVYALRHLKWPTIAVPLNVHYSSIKKIGLACDFEKVYETIPVEEITMLVKDFESELCIINTGKKEDFNPNVLFESQLLHNMFKKMQPTYHFITAEDKDQGIIDFVTQHNLDLLIIIPKSHSLLDKIMHISHTKKLVLHCHVPVMSLHHLPA